MWYLSAFSTFQFTRAVNGISERTFWSFTLFGLVLVLWVVFASNCTLLSFSNIFVDSFIFMLLLSRWHFPSKKNDDRSSLRHVRLHVVTDERNWLKANQWFCFWRSTYCMCIHHHKIGASDVSCFADNAVFSEYSAK